MNQKFLYVFPITLILFSFTSCLFLEPPVKGNGKVVEEVRKTADFNGITVSAGINVYVSQSSETKVTVIADQNLLNGIETRVDGKVLKITLSKNIWKYSQMKVIVSVPDIKLIKSIAGSSVFSEDTLMVDNLELICTAGANMKINVSGSDINVMSVAGSNLKLSGSTVNFEAKANSGSTIQAEGLKTSNCNIRCNSGANIWIAGIGNVDLNAGSGGTIYYLGIPSSLEIKTSSGGNIIQKEAVL